MVTRFVRLQQLQKGTLDHQAQRRGFQFSVICHKSPAGTASGVLLKVTLPEQVELPSGETASADQALHRWVAQRQDRVAVLSAAEADAFGKQLRPEQPWPERDMPSRRAGPASHGGTVPAFDINDYIEAA